MIDIDEIEARLKAATPGPWLVAYDADHPMNGGMPFNFVVATIGNDTIAEDLCGYDARFIAHAPEDIAALIAEVRMLRAENARLREAAERELAAEREAHELEKRAHEHTWQQKVRQIERAEAAEKRDATRIEGIMAQIADLERDRDHWRTVAESRPDISPEEAEKQARLGWERAAEKDRAYGDMIRDRDHWRTVAESRPDISREDAGKVALAPTDDLAAVIRVSDALRAHAAAPKGDAATERFRARAMPVDDEPLVLASDAPKGDDNSGTGRAGGAR